MDSFWGQVLIEFIGGFFGFGFAILIAYLTALHQNHSKKKMIAQNLINELNDIRAEIQKRVDKKEPLVAHIYTPTWDSFQYSGTSLELIDKPYYNNLISTYSTIANANAEYEKDNSISIDTLNQILEHLTKLQSDVAKEKLGEWHQESTSLAKSQSK